MTQAIRRSPVDFGVGAQESADRGGWKVNLVLSGEGDGPWLVDLSHRDRWDYQDSKVGEHSPLGLTVPRQYGEVSIQGDLVINRLNRTQVNIWHLGAGEAPATPDEVACTSVTDGHCMLAVVGPGTKDAMECVSNLDLFKPGEEFPFLTQGTIMHIPCQVVSFGPECVVFTFSRGYGQTFAEAMLHGCHGVGLKPAGEKRFSDCWAAAAK